MFAGIVEEVGQVVAVAGDDRSRTLTIRGTRVMDDLQVGNSIAVDGVCLTVVAIHGTAFRVDVGAETLRRTTLGRLLPDTPVNLERPLRLDGRLGGHLVQGHVDGVGTITRLEAEAVSTWMEVAVPEPLRIYLAEKGSAAVDGVSLTVARLIPEGFAASLVPHTLAASTLGRKRPGDPVNIEVDILAKYVERFVATHVIGTRRSDGQSI